VKEPHITATLQYVCDPDRRYANAPEALATIKVLRDRPRWKWVAKACPRCDGWHIFNEPREVIGRG
jgi:hypothetical protein